MGKEMLRAMGLGVLVLLAALALWGVGIKVQVVSESTLLLLFAAPGVAAFVSSWIAPRKKFVVGLGQAPVWGALASAANVAWAMTGGATDFPGGRGALWLFTLALLGALVPAVLGAAVGVALGRRRASPPA